METRTIAGCQTFASPRINSGSARTGTRLRLRRSCPRYFEEMSWQGTGHVGPTMRRHGPVFSAIPLLELQVPKVSPWPSWFALSMSTLETMYVVSGAVSWHGLLPLQ